MKISTFRQRPFAQSFVRTPELRFVGSHLGEHSLGAVSSEPSLRWEARDGGFARISTAGIQGIALDSR